MKIAISGKGGVGKTLTAASLAQIFAQSGYAVLAIDADSNANLAFTLGFPDSDKIAPISEMKELVEERTGTPPGQSGGLFRLNPKVDDIPPKYAVEHNGIKLMVLGKIKQAGSGCYCSENSLLRALLSHLLVAMNEVVILDMEAGVEHLGRATAGAVDTMIVVVEPGRASIETAFRINRLARDIGIQKIVMVGNKIRNPRDKEFITSSLHEFEFIGFIPYDQAIVDADLASKPVLGSSQLVDAAIRDIFHTLVFSVPTPATESSRRFS